MFLEYAHYLPERSSVRVVGRMKELVAVQLAGVDLRAPLNADQVIEHITALNEGVHPVKHPPAPAPPHPTLRCLFM